MCFFKIRRTEFAGFTLVEMMVTVALLGIVTAIAIPNFLAYLPDWRTRSAARDLYSNLQLAKMTAIKTRQSCIITYSTHPHGYSIPLLNKIVNLADYGSGVKFQGPDGRTFASPTVTFYPKGFCAVGDGYAYLSNAGNTVYYRVGPLIFGAVRLNKWNGSDWE